MKKYVNYILLFFGMMILLISCECKTCTKEGEVPVQVCRGTSETDYNEEIAEHEANGFTCKTE